MASPVALPSPGADPAAQPSMASTPAPAAPSAAPAPRESHVRLLIQKVDAGPYVYTVLDRATGRVIAQLPSSDVLSLMSDRAYVAGTLVKTKV